MSHKLVSFKYFNKKIDMFYGKNTEKYFKYKRNKKRRFFLPHPLGNRLYERQPTFAFLELFYNENIFFIEKQSLKAGKNNESCKVCPIRAHNFSFYNSCAICVRIEQLLYYIQSKILAHQTS